MSLTSSLAMSCLAVAISRSLGLIWKTLVRAATPFPSDDRTYWSLPRTGSELIPRDPVGFPSQGT
jgi:hypothetical protein